MNEEIKKGFLDKKSDVENELNEAILNCVEQIQSYDLYQLISNIMHYYKSTNIGIFKEAELGSENLDSKICLKYFQMIISCLPEKSFKNIELDDSSFWKIIENIKRINVLVSQYILYLNFKLEGMFNEAETDYILQDLLLKNVSGKRYDIFELEHYKDIFEPLKEEFYDCFGFCVESLYDGISNLKSKFTFGFESTIEKMEEFMNKHDVKDIQQNSELNKELSSIMHDMIGIELHNISEITKWPVEFIRLFSYELGENQSVLDNIDFFKFIDLEKKIKNKPLLKINDDYYCFLIQEFLDCFDKKVIKEMCRIKEENSEQIREKHTSNVEKIVQSLFLDILPNSQSYLNNYYKYKKQFAENDLLIEYDRCLFIIEIKSGGYSPEYAVQDFKSHYESLSTLLVKANEQSERLSEQLNGNDVVEIYDSNKKDKKTKCTLKKEDFDNIYKIVITLENFNEYEARAEKIGFIKLNDNTIFISLDDLRVYADYFENSPSMFIHYLKQRVLATNNDYINLNDELDHLGMYIDYNVYPIAADNLINEYPDGTNVLFDGCRDALDEYYNSKYLGFSNIEKPVQDLPIRINEIVEFCDSNRPENHILLTNNILDFSLDNKELINNTINEMITLFKNKMNPRYMFMSGDINFLIMAIYNKEDFEIDKYIDEAYANLIISCKNSLIFAIVFYDVQEKISKMIIKNLYATDDYDNVKCEELANNIRKNRIRRELMKNKKIGRNEMCPCGSGKKYKKCCLIR